jgi:hypothetical protein
VSNPHHGGYDDREGRGLNPLEPGLKAFESTVWDAWFARCFRAPNNIIKNDDKTNPSIWLENHRLTCWAGRANDDLLIIQFLLIYLAKSAMAWLDHLPRDVINSWEDLKENFTGNFQGTYVRPVNPWDLKSY